MDLDHQPHTVSVQSGPGQPTPQPAPSSSAPVTPAASAATSSTTPAASSAGTDAEIKGRFKVKHVSFRNMVLYLHPLIPLADLCFFRYR